jgi:GTPase SAR1 family protein
MTFETYRRNAVEVALELDKVADLVGQQLGLTDLAKAMRLEAQTTRDERFRCLVIGEFSRGKSTLLNSILSGTVLPQKVSEATCVITHIIYGETPHVKVVFQDGRPVENLTLQEFRKKYELEVQDTIDQKTEAQERFNAVDHAEVYFPLELCKHGVELVDSPGLGAHPVRRQRTIKNLGKAHAVVMVLDATQLLKEDEVNFLTDVLLPRGLRNVFFVINKWNMIEDHVVVPEDAEREKANLNESIRLRLHPHCVVNGKDRSADRIFRVNALGALKARLRKPVDHVSLEESNIPAFERSLQRFLLEDRGKALADSLRGKLSNAQIEIQRFIDTQVSLAEKPVGELEQEMIALQPKLDRLRGIRQHILNYLNTQSNLLQDQLINSLYEHVRKLDEKMPEEVGRFDLSPITRQSLVWAKLTDWTRSESNQLNAQIKRCIEPQVQRLFERHFGVWQNSVVRNEMKAVSIDVEKHLQEEAKEYQRVVQEIEKQIGFHGSPLKIDEQVRRWMAGNVPGGSGPINVPIGDGGDIVAVLIAGIVAEIIAEVVLHTVAAAVTLGISAIYSLIRMGMREFQMRQELTASIVKAIREGIKDIGTRYSSEIRRSIAEGFKGLQDSIGGNISQEIDLIEASLQTIIDQKNEAEFSAQALREKLELAKAEIISCNQRMLTLLNS